VRRRNPLWSRLLLAGAGILLMAFCALSTRASAHFGGELIPSNPDAFYHARRILDALMNHAPVIQFDPRIHTPEGSWLVWPWGYDQAMAWIVSLFGPFASEREAVKVLMYLPLVCIAVVIPLMVWLTWQLRMSLAMSAVAVLAFAAVPLNFARFELGNVDHHFAEQIWALLMLNCGLWLLRRPHSLAVPVVLGAVLGSAVAVHNALFLLPVLLVLGVGVAWLRGLPLPARSRLDLLGVSLVATTLLVCLPSQPWRDGKFDFALLSWFHVYVALCCAVYIAWMGRVTVTARNLALMLAVGAAALWLAYDQVAPGMQFASGKLDAIRNIKEAMSPYALLTEVGPQRFYMQVTWLFWLAVPALLLNIWWAWRSRDAGLVLFAAVSVVLLALMQRQTRLGEFAAMSLVMTPALAVQQFGTFRPQFARLAGMLLVLSYVLCFLPVRGVMAVRWTPGGDLAYGTVRGLLDDLGRACRDKPGVVLAPLDAGHWIRYHTDCSVIGNVFLLTPQQIEKAQETEALLQLDSRQLRIERPDVKYVLAYLDVERARAAGMKEPTEAAVQAHLAQEPLLTQELLRHGQVLPDGYEVISEATSPDNAVYARLVRIGR
jgi:hypothetical protein